MSDTAEVLRRQGPPRGDTSPEPCDHAAMAALLAPPREATTTIERPREPTDRHRSAAAGPAAGIRPPSRPSGHAVADAGRSCWCSRSWSPPRSAPGAWWFGYARYTTTPGGPRLSREAAAAAARGRRARRGDRPTRRTPRPSTRGCVLSTDPSAGKRVLDGGTDVTITVSLGKERSSSCPKLTGITEDEAQDRILDANLAFGKATEAFSETVPEGIVIASDPKAGSTLRPGTIVDLVVSKGRKPDPGRPTGPARAPTTAEPTLEQARASRSAPPSSTPTPSPRATSSPRAPTSGTLFRATRSRFSSRWAPSWSRSRAGGRAPGVDDAHQEPSRPPGSWSTSRTSTGYLGLGLRLLRRPRRRRPTLPKGSTVTLYLDLSGGDLPRSVGVVRSTAAARSRVDRCSPRDSRGPRLGQHVLPDQGPARPGADARLPGGPVRDRRPW